MKSYRVRINKDAEEDLRRYTSYVRHKLKNPEAARSIALDFKETAKSLADIAESIRESESEQLLCRGLKRINFRRHNYFLLFKLDIDTVFVTNMFHFSEDFENNLK